MLDKPAARLANNNTAERALVILDSSCFRLDCQVFRDLQVGPGEEKAMIFTEVVLPIRNLRKVLRTFWTSPGSCGAMLGKFVLGPCGSTKKLRQLVIAVSEGTDVRSQV